MFERWGLRRSGLLCAAALLFAAAAGARNTFGLRDLVPDPENWEYRAARVAGAIDGDTIKLEDGSNVRFLGINTPELAHPDLGIEEEVGGADARAWLQDEIAEKTVRLYVHKDHPTDKYGRTLALVFYWTGGSVNVELIEQGYAEPAYLYLKPDLNDEVFLEAEERAASRDAVGKVNVNTASAVELDAVVGIGPQIASEIIKYRTTHGPIRSLEELDDVKYIGPAKIEEIRRFITF